MNKCILIETFLREHHTGEEKAVHSKDLEDLFLVSGRALRKYIKQLRDDEVPICSCKDGYYYAKNQMEIKKSAAFLGNLSDSVSSTRMNLLSSRVPNNGGQTICIVFRIFNTER